MESRPFCRLQRLQQKHQNDLESSLRQPSLSLSNVPVEDNNSKLANSNKVSFERELWTSSITDHGASAQSNTSFVAMFSTKSSFTTTRNAPLLSQVPRNGTCVAEGLHSLLFQRASPGCFSQESNDAAWPGDSFFLDLPHPVSYSYDYEHGQGEGNLASISQEQAQQCDLQRREHLMPEPSFRTSNCGPLVAESDRELRVASWGTEKSSDFMIDQPQINDQVPDLSGESSHTGNRNKSRMRWTTELHECFVKAVNHLGGSEKATPKGVLNHMEIEGLSIYHVKSHLQKYRTTRYKPETSEVLDFWEDTSDSESLDEPLTSIEITEALRLQMEVQKQLHEQLEVQRNLQLQIEEQGRYLQMMIEKQSKYSNEFKTPTPSDEISVASPSAVTQSSSEDHPLENTQDHDETNATTMKTCTNSHQFTLKHRVPETGSSNPIHIDVMHHPPLAKRAKTLFNQLYDCGH